MTNKRHRSAAGFTLVEIVTVVTILAILFALALPGIASYPDLEASAASRVVISDLLYAQSQAIETGTTQYVAFTVAADDAWWGAYSLFDNTPLSAPIQNPVTQQPYVQSFGVGGSFTTVALTSVSLGVPANTVLAFDELGTPYAMPVNGSPVPLSTTGTISLHCGAASVTICIEPSTGNMTVSP